MFSTSKFLVNPPSTVVTDPYFRYTTLLLNDTGTNGAQNNTFIDSSTNNFTITRNGNTTQGSFNPYMPTGYWSGYFDGNGDYLSIPSNTAFAMATGDFTMECWFYVAGNSPLNGSSQRQGQLFSNVSGTSTDGYELHLEGSSTTTGTGIGFFTRVSGIQYKISYTGTVNQNTWYHIAVVRSGTTTTIYLNGTSIISGTLSNQNLYSVTPMWIGRQDIISPSYPGDFNGYISNLRFVKGTAVYTSNFTVPTTPLTAITNTSLLCLQDNRFKDNSSNNFTITRNGDTRVTHFNPFAPPASYTTSAYGGSAYFDGSGDYLNTPINAALDLSGDFTIECWVYPLNATGGALIIKRTSNISAAPYNLGMNSGTGAVYLSFSGSSNGTWNINPSFSAGTKPLYVGTWNHVAAVKSGTTITCYVNGQSDLVITGAANLYTLGQAATIGANDTSGGGAINAYVSNMRVVNGTAVYTSNFTPPTAPVTAITNTSLLLNATNAGIYDATAINNLETVGDAKVSTAQAKWGASSMYFDNAGDYLAFPSANELTLGTGSYTVECWIYNLELVDSNTLFTWWNSGTDRRNVHIGATYINYASQSALYIHVLHGMVINQWYHIALTYDGTTTRIFVNGVVKGTYAGTQMFTANAPFYIGAGGSSLTTDYFYGYIEDFRVTKGIARYTANFTPPTAAFPTR